MEQTGSRRAFLRYSGLAAVAGLAGCLGDDDSSENGSENGDTSPNGVDLEQFSDLVSSFELAGDGGEAFRDWVIQGNPIDEEADLQRVCRYENLARAEEVGYLPLQNHRYNTADSLGVDAATVTGELRVGSPSGANRPELGIIFGEFDADAIVTSFEETGGREVFEEYREYTVFERTRTQYRAAVGSEAVLALPNYEAYIDASVGERERLQDADDDFALLFSLLPAGIQTRILRRDDESGLAASGQTLVEVTADNSPRRLIETFVFESAEEASVDRARGILSADEILDSEQHDRAVMVSYRPS